MAATRRPSRSETPDQKSGKQFESDTRLRSGQRWVMQDHIHAVKHVILVLLAVAFLGAVFNGFVKEYKLYRTVARSEDAEE